MVPPESLFETVDSPRTVTLSVGPATVVAAIGSDGRVRVERVLSTDPAHYLEPSLMPGTDITERVVGTTGLSGLSVRANA